VDAGERGVPERDVPPRPLHHQLKSKYWQFFARKPQVLLHSSDTTIALSAYCCWRYSLNTVSGGFSIYAYILWNRTTKFDVVTYTERGLFYEVSHAPYSIGARPQCFPIWGFSLTYSYRFDLEWPNSMCHASYPNGTWPQRYPILGVLPYLRPTSTCNTYGGGACFRGRPHYFVVHKCITQFLSDSCLFVLSIIFRLSAHLSLFIAWRVASPSSYTRHLCITLLCNATAVFPVLSLPFFLFH